MSVNESQTFGKTRSMFEGYGGPVNVNRTDVSGIDPTLEACCQREIESNRKQTAVESTLRRHDRIALAERRRRNIVSNLSFGEGCRCCYHTNDGGEYRALIELRASRQMQQNGNQDGMTLSLPIDAYGEQQEKVQMKENNHNNDDDDDSDDDSEFDYLLDEELPGGDTMNNEFKLLQQERLEELQLSAMIRESAIQHGFGVHRQFHPQRVLHAAGLGLEGKHSRTGVAAIPPAAVIHLNDDTFLSASLDLCLEVMADNTYRGTKFVRSYGRSTMSFNRELVQKVLPALKIDSSLPALIAVKDGVVVSICENLSLFATSSNAHNTNTKDDEQVESRAVEEWLDRAGVLLHEVPIGYEEYCRIRPEEDALLENMMREKAKLEEIFDCGVLGCHKPFQHQHIGVKNEQQDGLLLCQETAIGS